MHAGFWWRNLTERDNLENLGVDRRIISKWIFNKWNGGRMDWTDLAQDRDSWRSLVNAVTNLQVL